MLRFRIVLAIGEDSVLDTPSGFDRFEKITVQLRDVAGFDPPVNYEVGFELDICVARKHIDAFDAVRRRRDFGLYLGLIVDDLGVQDEVAECRADVVFGVSVVVALQDFVEVLGRCVVGGIELGRLCFG